MLSFGETTVTGEVDSKINSISLNYTFYIIVFIFENSLPGNDLQLWWVCTNFNLYKINIVMYIYNKYAQMERSPKV